MPRSLQLHLKLKVAREDALMAWGGRDLLLDDAQRGSEPRRIRIPHEIRQRDLAAMAGIARERKPDHERLERRKLVDLEAHYFSASMIR